MEGLPNDLSRLSIVDIHSLKLWNVISPRDIKEDSLGDRPKVFEVSPFPFDDSINRKVALWVGDITLLNSEAIVNTTNETIDDRTPVSQRILSKGGPALRHFIKKRLHGCRTGDARITGGYDLASRYIIHAVGPKYLKSYHTAAENSLYSCYAKVLSLVLDNKIKSLGLCPINSARRGYPPQDGAHIALRIVRRFLEKYKDNVEMIIFTVENEDIGVYELLMPLYFPRSKSEEEYALYHLPKDIGGPGGEPFRPERQISISVMPTSSYSNDLESSIDLTSGLESSVMVGKTAFAKMYGDIDKRWIDSKEPIQFKDPISKAIGRRNRYERLLRKARTEDLSEIAALRCLHLSGEDRFGRKVIVIIGKRFKATSVNLEKALLYFMLILDRIVHKSYIVIYFHTLTTKENVPNLKFFRYAFEVLDYQYKKNLSALYIIHPTFWSRLITWWFTTFTASSIKDKVVSLGGIEYLRNIISLNQLNIPQFVFDYDHEINGIKYLAAEAILNNTENKVKS